MADLIERQAAIEAIEEMQIPIMRSEFNDEQCIFTGMSEALNAIKELPSAQPEIIRCKDCKHFAGEGMYCANDIIVQFDHFYCYDGERRTDDEG